MARSGTGSPHRGAYEKLADNFSHESDVTFLQDPCTSRPYKTPFYFIIVFRVKYEELSSFNQCILYVFLSHPSSIGLANLATRIQLKLSLASRLWQQRLWGLKRGMIMEGKGEGDNRIHGVFDRRCTQ